MYLNNFISKSCLNDSLEIPKESASDTYESKQPCHTGNYQTRTSKILTTEFAKTKFKKITRLYRYKNNRKLLRRSKRNQLANNFIVDQFKYIFLSE